MLNNLFDEKKCFSNSLVKLLTPLIIPGKEKLNIHTFGYRRFHEDGKSFGFSDNQDWNQTFCEQFTGIKIPEYERDLGKFMDSDRAYLLRTGIPDQNCHFLKALYEKDIWNTLSFPIINPNSNCLEVFFLSTHRKNTNVIEEYVNELNFIRQWIALIHTELLPHLENSSNKISKSNQYFATTVTNDECLRKFKTFLQQPPKKKPVALETSTSITYPLDELRILSVREHEILRLLTKKYKRRQIAAQLNLSPKTVDSYIARIKEKTNTFSKTSLLRELKNYPSDSTPES